MSPVQGMMFPLTTQRFFVQVPHIAKHPTKKLIRDTGDTSFEFVYRAWRIVAHPV